MFQWTRTGGRHLAAGQENQDALASAENEDFRVIALADGVSSCPDARRGAICACRTAAGLLLHNGSLFLGYEPRKAAAYIVAQVQQELSALSGSPALDGLASTLVCCLCRRADGRAMLFSLGDSLALTAAGQRVHIAAFPGDGRHGIHSTADADAASHACVTCLDLSPDDRVILCSDGAWQHFLDRDQIKPDVARMLLHRDPHPLCTWLDAQSPQDDSSFIILER